ncbi:hypothetical protein NIES4071_05580 [Calothrix sp. NIES-4071]|nr:hypothetical protein NIES4071_05580 [Calothrix sp. NIES-4071]BAZ54903.1 hypothetical protein NIES4105_05570 [Calothrix sp. NIES-4105]
MSIPLPNLDDRTYDDLVQEGLKLIPTYAPEWTNHNPSDPGITLIELFAYLTEMLNYRLNKVTDANKLAFLKLINGPEWRPPELINTKILNEEIQDAVIKLREPKRGVSCKDFEYLALEFNKQPKANQQPDQQKVQQVQRAHCLPRRDLEFETLFLNENKEKPGHISVIIVPNTQLQENPGNFRFEPSKDLLKAVGDYLEPKRLLTTRLHIVAPRWVTIKVNISLILQPGAKKELVQKLVQDALEGFFHPLTGGIKGKGWEFGRNIYISEIYQLLDKQPGVDYVTKRKQLNGDEVITGDPSQSKRRSPETGQLSFIKLNDDELVDFQFHEDDIEIIYPGSE